MDERDLSGRSLLRRLRILLFVSGAIAVALVVIIGDVMNPWLDRRIGVVASDAVEACIVAIVIFLTVAPQTRALSRSIMDLDLLRKRFYAESIHDALTGLFNRRHFDERLSEEFERARRYGQRLAIVVIDIDYFKSVNDDLGHAAGDAALIEIAGMLRQRHRRGDFLARIGGEEFAVLLPNLSLESAVSFADDVRGIIESEDFELPGRHGPSHRRITVSCGVAELRPDDEFDAALLRRADEALYEAKKMRNAVARR